MIKKHIISCSVILGLLVMAKVFAYNMPQAAKSQKKEVNTTSTSIATSKKNSTKTTITIKKVPASLMARLNFAKESLPLGDRKVER